MEQWRRKQWRKRVRVWVKAEVSDEEEDMVENEDTDRKDMDLNKENEEHEARKNQKELEEEDEKEVEMRESDLETELQKKAKIDDDEAGTEYEIEREVKVSNEMSKEKEEQKIMDFKKVNDEVEREASRKEDGDMEEDEANKVSETGVKDDEMEYKTKRDAKGSKEEIDDEENLDYKEDDEEEEQQERYCQEEQHYSELEDSQRGKYSDLTGNDYMIEMLTDEEPTAGESLTTQEFHDHQYHEEEEYTDDDEEEEEHSVAEDGGSNDDELKIYFKDDYPTEVFQALKEFKDSSILTDLTLNTEGGKSFPVHSVVLAAVSSLIWKKLSQEGNNRINERRDDDQRKEQHMWSISFGPEVDCVGLEAIVEFAYTGLISCLHEGSMKKIKAAAQALGAPRVLNLCIEEERSIKTGGQTKNERLSAVKQMMTNLQLIKQLWMATAACDVILEAHGASFPVHRVILAVSSDYFRAMFTLEMKESHQLLVTLPFLLASELEALIESSYSGALPISWRSIFETTSTALQLQYQPALSLCFKFLHQEINPHSCLDVASFAEAYEIAQLLEVADDFVLRNFQKVASMSKFQDLPAKHLLRYLNSHSLCVPSELVVFKAVVAWIQAKPRTRLRLAEELMRTVNFPLMTFKEFKEVQSQTIWSNSTLAELYESVFEDFCSSETVLQNQCRIYLPKDNLVLIGGDQISEDLGSRSISRELWFGNSLRNHTGIKKAMEWRKLGEMPEPPRFSHEVAVLKGQLYVFGGKKYYGISDTLNSVYRYDLLQNSWECLAEMQQKRSSFSVVVLDGKIYAIGGHCDPDYIDSVEQYCPSTNTWSFTWPLDLPLSGHVAKVLLGQIFISGGQNSDYLCLSSMIVYKPEMGSTYLASMAKPRAHHCMEVLGEYLYVAGGISTDDDMAVVDQLACEVYCPTSDSWTSFTSLPVPHVGAGSAVLENKFYVLGGYSQEDYSDVKMVHRYDATTHKWENMGKMPGPNNDIRASVLSLPQHFRL
ncbi:kelch-like protein 33 [Pholidichthys leucotaenia]